MKKTLIIGGLFIFAVSLWSFWISPDHINSPLVKPYYFDTETVWSPTAFHSDVFGNVYATFCAQSAFGKGCDAQKLPVDDSNFQLISRNLAISSESVYYAPGDGRVQVLDHLDPGTLRLVYGTDEKYIADKNGVYRNLHHKVSTVVDPEHFRPVASALKLEECIYSPGHGEYYLCDWYQDDTFVYFADEIISGADIDSFVVINEFEARDKNKTYVPD